MDLADIRALDERDPLARFRERFVVADDGLIYMDGNSLGRMPKAARERMVQLLDHEWGDRLIRSWNEGWYTMARDLGDKIGLVIGAEAGQVVVADSTSVNLYKLAFAALASAAIRPLIVTTGDNFPSDNYVLQGLARQLGKRLVCVEDSGLIEALTDQVALVCLSHVDYKSGRIAKLREVTAAAHSRGAVVLWDLSHSAGSVPIEVDAQEVDLAVGCTYKYLNGGPGAPAFLYVAHRHQGRLWQPIQGWFGHYQPFAFDPSYAPSMDISAYSSGTPPILSIAAIEAGVDLVLEAGMGPIRGKSQRLTSLFLDLAQAHLVPLGFRIGTPLDPDERGSHVTLLHPDAHAIDQNLIAEHHVIPDFRAPDGLRFGFAPLYTKFEEVWHAVERTREVVSSRSFEAYRNRGQAVT